MRIFILEDVDKLTYAFHREGGLVVVAKDLDAAKALVAAYKPPKGSPSISEVTDAEWASATVYELRGTKHEPKVVVFPDAGCC